MRLCLERADRSWDFLNIFSPGMCLIVFLVNTPSYAAVSSK